MAFDTARPAQVRWAAHAARRPQAGHAAVPRPAAVAPRRGPGPDPVGDRQDPDGRAQGAARACARSPGTTRVTRRRLLGPHRKVRAVPACSPRCRSSTTRSASSATSRPGTTRCSSAAADAIPALMAGNAVVLKPDHQTSLTALWTVDLLHRAGIPRRVMQVVLGYGPELGPEITERADYVMFTGSSAVGRADRRPVRRAADRLLDGARRQEPDDRRSTTSTRAGPPRSPCARASTTPASCASGSSGSTSLAGVYDAFLERFISRIGALRMHASVGWGTDFGSLISAEQLARITAAVDDAVAKGATVADRRPSAARDRPVLLRPDRARPGSPRT